MGNATRFGLGAAAALMTLAMTALGQTPGSGRFIVGSPVEIRNQPIDVSRAMRPTGSALPTYPATQRSAFAGLNFSNLFSNFSLGAWPPKTASSSVLPPNQNIFQPNPPKGGVRPFDPPSKKTSGTKIGI